MERGLGERKDLHVTSNSMTTCFPSFGSGVETTTGLSGILRKGNGGYNGYGGSNKIGRYGNSIISGNHYYGSKISGNDANGLTSSANSDLLVFGYACKLYRDDAKALEIDQGKHLIPWMDDTNLKIDRYDVRGTLYEMAPYEAPIGGYGNRLDYLTAEEQRAEQLCEEERYLFLHQNEENYIEKQEEEFKRSHQLASGGDYCQVNFVYDQPSTSNSAFGTDNEPSNDQQLDNINSNDANDQQPFQLPLNFEVPNDIKLPDTVKQHAIIEKTARFIAKQGIQMEILLKAKQSNNIQFDFLSQNGILNPYYKYILNAMKNGTYPEIILTENNKKQQEQQNDCGFNYSTNDNDDKRNEMDLQPIVIPTIKYKPSPDCAYTQLISKIKGVPLNEIEKLRSDNYMNDNDNKIISQPNSEMLSTKVNDTSSHLTQEQGSLSGNNRGSQLTSNTEVKIINKSSALALAQNYNSDTESEEDDNNLENSTKQLNEKNQANEIDGKFPIPEENLRNIIDKTALYVIKNGRKFEQTLLIKSQERFIFLLPDNEFYPYYLYKVTSDPDAASKEQKQRKAAAVAAALLTKKGIGTEKNLSFPQQDRTADEEEVLTDTQLHGLARVAELAAAAAISIPPPPPPSSTTTTTANRRHYHQHNHSSILSASSNSPHSHSLLGSSSHSGGVAILKDKIASKLESNKETKYADEKIKDKLAQIAREKLGGLVSKDKQLQSERKRRAMDFLNQIRNNVKADLNDNAENTVKKAGFGNMDIRTESVYDIEINNRMKSDNENNTNMKQQLLEDKQIPIKFFGPEDQINLDDDDEDGDSEKYNDTSYRNYNMKIEKKTKLVQKKESQILSTSCHLLNHSAPITISDDDDKDDCSGFNKLQLKRDGSCSSMQSINKIKRGINAKDDNDDEGDDEQDYSKYMLCSLSENSNSVTSIDTKQDYNDKKSIKTKNSSSSSVSHHKKKKSKSKSKSKSKMHSRSCSRSRSRFRSQSRSISSLRLSRRSSRSSSLSSRKRAKRCSSRTSDYAADRAKSKHKDYSKSKDDRTVYDNDSKSERNRKKDYSSSIKSSSSKHRKHKKSRY